VYRAIDIITSAVAQLPLRVERHGVEVPAGEIPDIIKAPSLSFTRSDFLEQIALSLAVTGNAYILAKRIGSKIVELVVLNPHEVLPTQDETSGVITYSYRGRDYRQADIQHLKFMVLPGSLKGLGAIQAARAEIQGAINLRDYAAQWFNGSGQPSGILSTDQALTAEDAKQIRDTWNNIDPATGKPLPAAANPSNIKVTGKGVKYDPIVLSPRDAQFIESRNFDTLEIARLFGIPATLMLTSTEGSSMTYSNVEQDWLGFVRFTLTKYLRKIEEALTTFTPRGQTVRFQISALLRSDTLTRYQAHQIALNAGFMTLNEVRAIESLPPLETQEPKETVKP
jgi:HK97 family phage portal protein